MTLNAPSPPVPAPPAPGPDAPDRRRRAFVLAAAIAAGLVMVVAAHYDFRRSRFDLIDDDWWAPLLFFIVGYLGALGVAIKVYARAGDWALRGFAGRAAGWVLAPTVITATVRSHDTIDVTPICLILAGLLFVPPIWGATIQWAHRRGWPATLALALPIFVVLLLFGVSVWVPFLRG